MPYLPEPEVERFYAAVEQARTNALARAQAVAVAAAARQLPDLHSEHRRLGTLIEAIHRQRAVRERDLTQRMLR